MFRRVAILAAPVAALPLFAAPVSAAPATTLSMTFLAARGRIPMAFAQVSVFWVPPTRPNSPDGTVTKLPLIGSGTANANGRLSVTLDTSAIPSSDLGDVGEGGSTAFNALVFSYDSARNYNVTQAIIAEDRTFTDTVAAGVDPVTGQPALLSPGAVRGLRHQADAAGIPAVQREIGHEYRYSPVTPLNSGSGMTTILRYTYTSSKARQSEFQLPTTEYGGWSLTTSQLEQNDRTINTGLKVNGSYHRWVWADYFMKFYLVRIGTQPGEAWHQWEPDHFQGTISANDPNCCISKRKHTTIGRVPWKEPKFAPGPGGNWYVRITANSLPWERSSGKRESNSVGNAFTLGNLPGHIVGGGITVNDSTTYGSITSVAWQYRRGCPSGSSRVVWGQKSDPVAATRVQADCLPNSRL